MGDFHVGKDEQIILESFNAIWVSRNSLQLSHFVLTNQKMHCFYKKKNGLFKKSTKEEDVFYLSSIAISSGEAQISQTKESGNHLLQMRFGHGVEKFYFPEISKKKLSQCILKLHEVLDDGPAAAKEQTRKKRGGLLNSMLKMEEKRLGYKTAAEYISDIKEKHYLLVKCRCIPKTIIPNVFDASGDDFYQFLVYNEKGNCVFRVNTSSSFVLGKECLGLFDQNGNEVGSVEENLISLCVPFLEKNSKDYTVRYKGEELCQITACISMGSRDISCSGSVRIDRYKNHFLVKYKNKKVAQVYIVQQQIQRGYVDDFVIGYDDAEHSALVTLLCLAYNLAEQNLSDS